VVGLLQDTGAGAEAPPRDVSQLIVAMALTEGVSNGTAAAGPGTGGDRYAVMLRSDVAYETLRPVSG